MMNGPFNSIYTHHYLRSAVCIPKVKVADPAYNAEQTLELARQASERHAAVALFPELGISGYTNDDLFHQDALLDASVAGLRQIIDASAILLEADEYRSSYLCGGCRDFDYPALDGSRSR